MSTELRQTSQYAKYMESLGWEVLELKRGINIFVKKVLPYFFIAKIQRFAGYFTEEELKSSFTKKGIYVVYLEPNEAKDFEYLKDKKRFNRTKSPLVPSKTIRINLTKTDDQLLGEMHYKTRYNIKKVHSSKFIVQSSKDIKKFAEFWQRNALSRGMFLNLKKEIIKIYEAFGKNACVLIAENEEVWLSAIMVLMTEDRIYYMYAASTKVGNKMFAPTALVWEAMTLGKKLKKKYFDFEGIYDKRFPLPAWKGFTRFKKSFGGEEVVYPGTLRKVFVKSK